MRVPILLATALLSGCLSANASTSQDVQDELSDDAQPEAGYYLTMVRVEMAWSGFVGTSPGTSVALQDYSKTIAAEGDVTSVDSTIEWDDPLDSALRACITRDGTETADIPCAEGTSPLNIAWAHETAPLPSGEYTVSIEPAAGAPVEVVAANVVQASLTVAWVLPIP